MDKILELLTKLIPQEPELISPIPQAQAQSTPQVQTIPGVSGDQTRPYGEGVYGPQRPFNHPLYSDPQYQKTNNGAFEALLSATEQASRNTGTPQNILMDMAAIESTGGTIQNQLSGGPGRGPYQFEMPLPEDLARQAPAGFDPLSATQSAQLAAEQIAKGRIGRWGKQGGTWGSVDNQTKNPKDRLTTYYPELR